VIEVLILIDKNKKTKGSGKGHLSSDAFREAKQWHSQCQRGLRRFGGKSIVIQKTPPTSDPRLKEDVQAPSRSNLVKCGRLLFQFNHQFANYLAVLPLLSPHTGSFAPFIYRRHPVDAPQSTFEKNAIKVVGKRQHPPGLVFAMTLKQTDFCIR
jgi:hypothetical protein